MAISVQNGIATISMFGPVGGDVTAAGLAEQIEAAGEVNEIVVRINSNGGSAFEGFAIFNMLKEHPAKVVTRNEGAALSAASMIFMAGDERRMAANSILMIHDPSTRTAGNANEHRKRLEMLDRVSVSIRDVYAKATGRNVEEVAKMMSDETWMTAEEALANGFATHVTGDEDASNNIDWSALEKAPAHIRNSFLAQEVMAMADKPEDNATKQAEPAKNTTPNPEPTAKAGNQPATYAELKSGLPGADADFICSQQEAEATLPQAQKAWMAEQSERLKAANEKAEKATAAKPGVTPVTNAAAKESEADGQSYWDAVSKLEESGVPRSKAISKAAKANPEAYQAMLEAANSK